MFSFLKPKTSTLAPLTVQELSCYLDVFPDEILLQFLASLDTHTLLMLMQTSKRLKLIVRDNSLWQERFFQFYPHAAIISSKEKNRDKDYPDFFASYLSASKTYFSKVDLNGKYIFNLINKGDISKFDDSPKMRTRLAEWLLTLLSASEADEINDNVSLDYLNPFYLAHKKEHQHLLDYFYGVMTEYCTKKNLPTLLLKIAVHCHQTKENIINQIEHEFHRNTGLSLELIWIAIKYQYLDLIKKYLIPNREPWVCNMKTDQALVQPIMLAAKFGKVEVLKTLMLFMSDSGIHNNLDYSGRNILQIAAHHKQTQIISVLLDSRPAFKNEIGELKKIHWGTALNGENLTFKESVLHAAATKNSDYTPQKAAKTILTLLKNCDYESFDPNAKSHIDSQPILHWAVEEGLVDVVEELAKFKKLNVLNQDYFGAIAFNRVNLIADSELKNKIAYPLLEREDFLQSLQGYLALKDISTKKKLAATTLRNYIEEKQREKSPLLLSELQKICALHPELSDGRLQNIFNRIVYLANLRAMKEPKEQASIINNSFYNQNKGGKDTKLGADLRQEISDIIEKEIKLLSQKQGTLADKIITCLSELKLNLKTKKERTIPDLIKQCKIDIFSQYSNLNSHSLFSPGDDLMDTRVKDMLAYLDELIIDADYSAAKTSRKTDDKLKLYRFMI